MPRNTLSKFSNPRKKRNGVAVGNRYSKLVVIEFLRRHRTSSGGILLYWKCRCDCGNESEVTNRNLLSGHTRSCGCVLIDWLKENKTIHGFARKGNVHWLHHRWRKIVGRCDNPNTPCHHRYGGRGIKLCDGWRDFKKFYEDMGLPLSKTISIDRVDNNGHYSCGQCPECIKNHWPKNCRWATKVQQANNKSSNVFIELNGEKLTKAQWSRKCGISMSVIDYRLNRGLSPEQCLDLTNQHTGKPLKISK